MQVFVPPASTARVPISAGSLLEDALGRLDSRVSRKARLLLEAPDTIHASLQAAIAGWQEARRQLTASEAEHRACETADARTIDGRTPRPSTIASGERLAQAREREASRRRGQDEAQAAFTPARVIADAVDKLLRSADVAALTPVEVTRARHTTPRDAAGDLARLRASIAATIVERAAIESAPVPIETARERLDAYLANAASQYSPPLHSFMVAGYAPPTSDSFVSHKLLSTLAALPPFRTVLHELLAVAYQHAPTPVPPGERPAQLLALADRLRKLETDEERVILEAGADGFVIFRRPDADPVVVLTVVLVD